MTNPSIPPCPECGDKTDAQENKPCPCITSVLDAAHRSTDPNDARNVFCDTLLGRAMRDLGIETVEQVRELVGIACDACDERTVRATNRAENLVPLLRRRAAEGEK